MAFALISAVSRKAIPRSSLRISVSSTSQRIPAICLSTVQTSVRSISSTSNSASAAATATSPAPTPTQLESPFAPSASSAIADQLKYELDLVRSDILMLLASGLESLDSVAKYYFMSDGKALRPRLVLLMSLATNGLSPTYPKVLAKAENSQFQNESVAKRRDVLNDENPAMPETREGGDFSNVWKPTISQPTSTTTRTLPSLANPETDATTYSPTLSTSTTVLPTQRRLAALTEIIHAASLLHDDVIDGSPMRRGVPSAPSAFGNKFSILAGDFLLGRTSANLARLQNPEVVELMATVIANLVEGEVMQLEATQNPETVPTKEGFEFYLRKSYMKTASLMAKSCRGAVCLGSGGDKNDVDAEEWIKDLAYAYGRNLGIAFQLVDDMLDFSTSPEAVAQLGKPSSGADLQLGLATAPLLYAWEVHPELGPLIARRFTNEGDVELAKKCVENSDGLERTKKLAMEYAEAARKVIVNGLPKSEARDELERITEGVVARCR